MSLSLGVFGWGDSGVFFSGIEQRLGQQGTQYLDSSSPRPAVQNVVSTQYALQQVPSTLATLEFAEGLGISGGAGGCKMQTNSPLHYNTHHNQ
eukprot:g22776.t1